MFARLDPGFHFGQVPYDAPWCQVEAARELAAALHFVDRGFGEGNDLSQFVTTDGSTEGQRAIGAFGNCGSAS